VAHRRIGADGRAFWMLKFRTMWGARASDGERSTCCGLVSFLEGVEHASAAPKNGHDPRVASRLAAFLRRHSLDEMPQLLHVIAGRMSLVGPRPLLESELLEHYGRDAAEVLALPPGMTGLWQVKGRSRLTYPQRKRLDLFLVRHNSIGLQIRILAKTFPQVWKGANSW
jgi:exopolysaccharide production protein ExoY